MSETSKEAKPEKREREEDGASPAAEVAGSDDPAPAAKKIKAADTTAEPQASMEVEIKEEGKGSQAAVAAEAPLSEEKVKEVEAGVLKMLEFYFGDSNFSWDRFMQSKAGKMGGNLMDVSILLSFNKLKKIVKDAGLSDEDGRAMIARVGEASPKLRVSEDKKKIGRVEPMTAEADKERLARTVQTKGYGKDSTIQIEGVEKLFADIGKATYVKICKARSSGAPKLTSIFVEFETKEQADKAVESSGKISHEGAEISIRLTSSEDAQGGKAKKDEDKANKEPPAPEPVVYEAGKIIHITGIPEEGVSRENLKEAVSKFGTAAYVDFSFGKKEAWIRMDNPLEAAAALEGCKETGGLLLVPEAEHKGTVGLVEGDEEKEYYERVAKLRAERISRGSNRGRGGRGGRGKRRGRGGGGRG